MAGQQKMKKLQRLTTILLKFKRKTQNRKSSKSSTSIATKAVLSQTTLAASVADHPIRRIARVCAFWTVKLLSAGNYTRHSCAFGVPAPSNASEKPLPPVGLAAPFPSALWSFQVDLQKK
jgi:hypothetical protein